MNANFLFAIHFWSGREYAESNANQSDEKLDLKKSEQIALAYSFKNRILYKACSATRVPVFFDLDETAEVSCVDLNRDASLLAFTCTDKTLGVWDTSCCELVSSRVLSKKAACLRIATWENQEVLLVADKTGDVLVFGFPNLTAREDPYLALGHTGSVLTGMASSACGRYLVTCDRDEKLRVSNWPHTSIIQAYCLGHTDYVACCACPPSPSEKSMGNEANLVISGGGDGRVILWDLLSGANLGTFMLPLKTENEDNGSNVNGHLPVSVGISDDCKLAAVLFQGQADLIILHILESGENRLSIAGKISCRSSPLALRFTSSGHLVALVEAPTYIQAWTTQSILENCISEDIEIRVDEMIVQACDEIREMTDSKGLESLYKFHCQEQSHQPELHGELRKDRCKYTPDWNVKKQKKQK